MTKLPNDAFLRTYPLLSYTYLYCYFCTKFTEKDKMYNCFMEDNTMSHTPMS